MNAICPYCWLTIISKLVSHHQSYATFISNFLVVIINVDSNHHWWYWYIPGRNFRSNCRNYRRALLLFEMDVANPPSPVQIEAIVFSRSKAKNCFYLYEPLENMQKHRVFWVLLIKYDNFSGKLTRIVHFCAKMCKKTCAFNSFWTFDSMFDHKWVWSLSKLCSVQHGKAGWARPVFSILGKDKRDPNETVFCSLDVSLRSPLQSSPIK